MSRFLACLPALTLCLGIPPIANATEPPLPPPLKALILDGQNNRAVTEVLSAWMEGQVPESSLRRALTDSGEMARWDSVHLTAPEQRRVEEAQEAVNNVLRSTPPGNPQTHLAKADGLLREVLDHLRQAEESGE